MFGRGFQDEPQSMPTVHGPFSLDLASQLALFPEVVRPRGSELPPLDDHPQGKPQSPHSSWVRIPGRTQQAEASTAISPTEFSCVAYHRPSPLCVMCSLATPFPELGSVRACRSLDPLSPEERKQHLKRTMLDQYVEDRVRHLTLPEDQGLKGVDVLCWHAFTFLPTHRSLLPSVTFLDCFSMTQEYAHFPSQPMISSNSEAKVLYSEM